MINTNFNPTFDKVLVGDIYSGVVQSFDGVGWFNISTVLSMDPVSKRFGKEDRIVTVKVETSHGVIVEHKKSIWVSQLLKGV